MSEPTPMDKRPKIDSITYYSAEGNPYQFIVGRNCTEIRETQEGRRTWVFCPNDKVRPLHRCSFAPCGTHLPTQRLRGGASRWLIRWNSASEETRR
jgi:hypothetical protein